MKKIKFILFITYILISSVLFAANPSKEINNKCRQNLKRLKSATENMLKQKDYQFTKWTSYEQALNSFLDKEKYLDNKDIEGPTPDCKYYLVNIGKGDWQWLCFLHGILDGKENYSLNYHEYQLQGKGDSKYLIVDEYKNHVQNMLGWTNYTLTPLEFLKYHYNMNPIITTILTLVIGIGGYILLKQFFKF